MLETNLKPGTRGLDSQARDTGKRAVPSGSLGPSGAWGSSSHPQEEWELGGNGHRGSHLLPALCWGEGRAASL